jgi:TRAP-type transport system periplasmic protein
MTITRRLVLSTALAAGLALSASPAAFAQEFTFTFGGSDAPGSLLDRQNAMFSELVNERSDGRIQVNFISGEALGPDIQVIEQMMEGAVDFYGDVLDWYANWVEDFGVLNWGFTFRDNDHAQRFLESEVYQELADELREEYGIRILAAAPTQPRVMFSTKRIEAVEDLQDLKMRVPEILTYLRVWETLGTAPSRVDWGEVYLALRTGVVEASEGPISAAYAARLHEPVDYVIRTDHLISMAHITMNEQSFQSLPEDLQELVLETAREATQWARQQAEEETEEIVAKMEAEGATVVEVDVEPFAEKLRDAVGDIEAQGLWREGLWEKIHGL